MKYDNSWLALWYRLKGTCQTAAWLQLLKLEVSLESFEPFWGASP
jgi:hypothetical protein